MAPTVESIEISGRPEDVFSYMTDLSHLPEWQESAVSVRREGDAPLAVGSRFFVTRRFGRRQMAMSSEVTELNPPSGFAVRGVDGPVRGIGGWTIEPCGDGERSRVTLTAEFEGHGIGKLLIPLVVRPRVRTEIARDLQKLKQRLESGA